MAAEETLLVKTVKLTEMTGKSGKSFVAATVTTEDGRTFNGYDNQIPKDLKSGDSLAITFSAIKTKSGETLNKIITSKAPGTTGGTKPTTFKRMETTKQPTTGTATTTTTSKTYDGKGARVGGVLHDAVALAIHNAAMERTSVSVSTVEGLAQELLQLAARLEK